MTMSGTLIFFCGKMGAGKSTKALEVASDLGAVLISEDEWLAKLYPIEISKFDDYLKYSSRLKPLIKSHVQRILNAGVSVVMDFPGNTKNQRSWFKELFLEEAYPHKLIYLEATDALCLSRLSLRRESQPERTAFDTEAVFRQVTKFFEAPSIEEGFKLEIIGQQHA
jgi:predicted kinase